MTYKVEHKIIHNEWDEAIIPAEVVLANPHLFEDEDGWTDGYPTLRFEKVVFQ